MSRKLKVCLERREDGKYVIFQCGILLTGEYGLCPDLLKDMFNLKRHLRKEQSVFGDLSCKFTPRKKKR